MVFDSWIEKSDRLREKLSLLSPESPPAWGRMGAQQMIEHLLLVCEISNGTKKAEVLTPEKHIEKAQTFLMSDQEMPKNFIAKFIPEEPIPNQFSDLNTAIRAFIASVEEYHAFWKENEETTGNHPVFGRLNKEKWNRVHNKHITHHLAQFNLL